MKLYNSRVIAVLATALMLGQLSAPALAAEVSASAGSVNINEAFSDPLFRAWLEDRENLNGIGADGVLTEEERAAVLAVDVSGETIQSLSGIELFPNLRSLNISNNRITALDLSQNTPKRARLPWRRPTPTAQTLWSPPPARRPSPPQRRRLPPR